jgi:hypothetical protein
MVRGLLILVAVLAGIQLFRIGKEFIELKIQDYNLNRKIDRIEYGGNTIRNIKINRNVGFVIDEIGKGGGTPGKIYYKDGNSEDIKIADGFGLNDMYAFSLNGRRYDVKEQSVIHIND